MIGLAGFAEIVVVVVTVWSGFGTRVHVVPLMLTSAESYCEVFVPVKQPHLVQVLVRRGAWCSARW